VGKALEISADGVKLESLHIGEAKKNAGLGVIIGISLETIYKT